MEYKGFNVVSDGTMGYFLIKIPGGGPTPKDLSGLYTRRELAHNAIDCYKPKRGAKKNHGEVSTTI